MTVSTTKRREELDGNGSTTTFSVPIRILEADHAQLTHVASDGTETRLVRGTDYTIDGVMDPDGFTFDFPESGSSFSTLASDEQIVVLRDVPADQQTDLRNQGGFYPEVVETAFDKLTMMVQQVRENLNRAFKLPIGTDASVETVLRDFDANRYLAVNGTGTGLHFVDADPGETTALRNDLREGNAVVAAFQRSQPATYDSASSFLTDTTETDEAGENVHHVGRRVRIHLQSSDAYRYGTVSSLGTRGASGQVDLVDIVDGSGASASLLNEDLTVWVEDARHQITVDSVSDLQGGTFPSYVSRLWLSGYYGVGTPGGGPLYRDADDTSTSDNGGTVFVDADGVRWKRPTEDDIYAEHFGAKGDDSTDDAAAIQAGIDFLNSSYQAGTFGGEAGVLHFGPRIFRHSGIVRKKGVSLKGQGQANTILLLDADGGTGVKTPAKDSQAAADAVSQGFIQGIGFGIHSSLTPTASTVLLDTTGMTKCQFEDLAFTCPSDVIGIDNTGNTLAGSGGPAHWYNTWWDVHVYVTGGIGCRWGENDSSSGEQVTAQDWHGGSFKGTGGTGIHIRGGTGINFFGSTFEGLNGAGDDTVILGDSSGSRTTTSVNMHGCYWESAKITYHSNTNRCRRWGGFETSVTETDNGDRNGRVDHEQLYRQWPRVYVSGRITTSGLTIEKSYGVDTGTGVTKPTTGVYEIPFTDSMPDTDYIAQGISESSDLYCRVSTKNTGSVRFAFLDSSGTLTDPTSFGFTVIDHP